MMTPKKWVFMLLTAFVFVNTLVFSLYSFNRPLSDLNNTFENFLEVTNFHRRASALFAKIKSDRSQFWFTDSSITHNQASIDASKILVTENNPESLDLFYDPRLTLSAYMSALKRAGNSLEPPTLPFHWVDWLDLTMTKTQFGVKKSKKMSCNRLKNVIKFHPNTEPFCKNNNDYTDEQIEQMGYRNRDQLPIALIHGHAEHPSYNGVRVFMGKSYGMTHLPKPLKVIMLNAVENGGGTYEFLVDQKRGSEQRLMYSGLTEKFVESQIIGSVSSLVENNGKVNFDHLKIYEDLVANVDPYFITEDEDQMSMHYILKSPPGSPKEIHLEEKHFNYPKSDIKKYIEQYEGIESRSLQEQNTLEGLKECARYDGSNEPTYFKMATLDIRERKNYLNDWGWHYDWRFFNDALFYDRDDWTKEERVSRTNIILERLLRNWNRFAEEKGIVSWIMHGPLLSWYWDGLMFPYDVDIDIQMPVSELVRLSKDYNQTLVLESPTEGFGKYLIDVGSYIYNRDRSDTGNHIDARFVDVDSGIYIDITGLSRSNFQLPDEYKERPIVQKHKSDDEVYNDRRKHFYTLPQLSPLKYSMLAGVPTLIPNEIQDRLKWEYSKGLENYEFHDWYFVPKIQLWVMKSKLVKVFEPKAYENEKGEFQIDKMVELVKGMSDDEGLKLLEDPEILAEFYQTSQFTQWHTQEKRILFDAEGKDNLTALNDRRTRAFYDNLVGQIKFTKPLRKCLYEYETFDRLQHRDQPALRN